jgi:signal transduction histidine kinase
MICPTYNEPVLLVFSTDAPDLLYYSHIPTIIIALLIGSYVFIKNRKSMAALALFSISLLFSIWTVFNLIVWTSINSDLIMFVSSLFHVVYVCIYVMSLYFVYEFFEIRKNISVRRFITTSSFILLFPVVLLAPSIFNINQFDLMRCAVTSLNPHYENYSFGIPLLITLVITILLSHLYVTKTGDRNKILSVGFGLISFLLLFIITSYIPTLIVDDSYTIEFYGLLASTFFMVSIGYAIVRYKAFNIKLFATQALMVGLIILIGSQLFFVRTTINTILTATTLIISAIGGYLLIRSVMKEIKQREELQIITEKLSVANRRLQELDKAKSEFLSVASHQLRSPLTAIRGYTSMMLDGDFGKVSPELQVPLSRIYDSARLMAMSIEDYLNVSRIEAGNMKYMMTDVNLPSEVENLCDDMRHEAVEKGLLLVYQAEMHSKGIIRADVGKVVQIIQNLITNSLKYTERGSVRVIVRDDMVRKKVYVDVIDTGIGIRKEMLANLFQKFQRAQNASSVNMHGTGLGLFVALKMAEAMGGTITVASEGDGKGSRFTVEFPLAL